MDRKGGDMQKDGQTTDRHTDTHTHTEVKKDITVLYLSAAGWSLDKSFF